MANMFRCSLSGGALKLTVTCSPQFAGLVITATDGTNTLTQTCPSTSPYEVEFNIPNSGQWTISGVISGDSKSIIVDIPSTAVLYNTPNGSTATPTDDIQTWLHCANIWDKNYTTISQVLADASTLQALIVSNNAVDYMARSATWSTDVTADARAMAYIGLDDYCADTLLGDSTWLNAICNSTYFESVLNVKVPTMTSDTTPSGVASASRARNGYPAWKAFDSDVTSYWWASDGSAVGDYVAYEFTEPINVKKVYFKHNNADANHATKIAYEKYINGAWQTVQEINTSGRENTAIIDSNEPCEKNRIRIVAVTAQPYGYALVEVVQFYGRASS